jgi:outer membrane protein assembly factor BamA
MPSVVVRPEDGVAIGLSYTRTDYRFKREPYGAVHAISASLATATLGFEASYRGHFVDVAGRWDHDFGVHVRTPTNTRTFFGETNSVFAVDDLNVYRVRQESQGVDAGLSRRWSNNAFGVALALSGERTSIRAEDGKFVTSADAATAARVFDPQYFVGINAEVDANTVDNPALPLHGVVLSAGMTGLQNLERSDGHSLALRSQLALYYTLDRKERVVFSTSVAGAHVFGDPEFFQMPTLGGDSMRAYYQYRLTGTSSFVNQSDLRLQLFNHLRGNPVVGGLSIGVDHGRVWSADASVGENNWHASVGGGAWVSMLNSIGLAVDYFVSVTPDAGENQRVVVSIGPLFNRAAQ